MSQLCLIGKIEYLRVILNRKLTNDDEDEMIAFEQVIGINNLRLDIKGVGGDNLSI